MDHPIAIEVCVDSIESALAAQAGGADRIELCANLPQGGTTPSAGLIEEARACLKTKLHVLVRPRAGDFVYSAEEIRVIERDIELSKRFGADGIVIGVLTSDRNVDAAALRSLIEAARPMHFTFHRAFDLVPDPATELDVLLEFGVERLLTSGHEPTAVKGHRAIGELVGRAGNRLSVMAGGGISKMNVRWLIEETGIREVHAGEGVSKTVGAAGKGLFEAARQVVDAEEVRALRIAAETKRA